VGQFHWDPDNYLRLMREEVPAYDRLQDEAMRAAAGLQVKRILDLGTGTGETAVRALALYPKAELVGVDASAAMLAHARSRLGERPELRVARLEEQLPEGSSVRSCALLASRSNFRKAASTLSSLLSPSTTSTGRANDTSSGGWRTPSRPVVDSCIPGRK
jgi:trans-aconitate methyltransferase